MAIYGTLGGQDSTSTGYPSIRPTLDLNFAQTKTLDPRVTFYRDSLGTYVDSLGIVRTVPANVPRFDHNPTTGESLGLLIEESRTNNLLHSKSLDNTTVWGQYASTVSQDSTISPSGQSDAYKITLGQSPSGSYQGIIQGVTLSSSNYYTFSCFVKAGSQTVVTISESYSFGYFISANLSTKQITSNGGYVVSQGIQEYPNGWFRIYGVWDLRTISGSTYTVWDINLSTNSSSGIYCYAWGAQLEAGFFPTSYIPTSGSTVTRSADTAYMDGTNLTSWYSTLESTMFIQASNDYFSSSFSHAGSGIELHSGVFQSQMIAFNGKRDHLYYPAGLLDIFSSSGASVYGGGPVNTRTNASIVYKTAYAYKSGSLAVSADGYNAGTSSSTFTHPTATRLQFGSNFYAYDPFNGKISRLMYYPKTLTASQLQNLTAL
jgi:hypothetical protein